ncbi:hypothetical protein F0U60_06830 [Archangium minus]|uniref:Uncharacterized protein n=1 Tax=Archangium minus TaxID=83450 RepID=A0ABY9WJA3_9BACT|nr:hypothetical protein F0U60_06830 [Archangium minus]
MCCFMQYRRAHLSKKVGKLVDWSGGFWERRDSAEAGAGACLHEAGHRSLDRPVTRGGVHGESSFRTERISLRQETRTAVGLGSLSPACSGRCSRWGSSPGNPGDTPRPG